MAAPVSTTQAAGSPRLMLLVLSAVTFLMTGTGTARAPFLLAMASDLESSLAAVANLVALSSITWGLASLAAGLVAQRFPRRRVLTLAVISLALAQLAVALAPNYLLVALAVAWGGFSGGTYSATVYATVAESVPPGQRGRALGWIMTGQSLALVLGVPLATLIGIVGGWRGANAAQGLAAAGLALAVLATVRAGHRAIDAGQVDQARPAARRVLTGAIGLVLAAGIAERICYASMVVYLATYLLTSYGIGLDLLAIALALVALGNVAGNLIGSQLADRLGDRLLLVTAASLATSLLALPLYWWQPGIIGSITLGFGYALINALGRPPLIACLSLLPGPLRSTVLGLNVTAASVGWLAAAAIGGWLIVNLGFVSLGWLGAGMGLLGGLLALAARWSNRRRPLADW
jgi:DHA1 family inner membrane transport protein